jgi:nucleoside-diphosphate-sugar epimerase
MVVGKGLIARALSGFQKDGSVLIFASGVSNSAETREEEYQREKRTLLSHDRGTDLLVYFSTSSVFDPSQANSRYVIHKKEMEELVTGSFKSSLVIRLPILVGSSHNPYTFFNFIRHSIDQNRPFELYKNAWRYLFDVEDLISVFPLLLREFKQGKNKLNVSYDNGESVVKLVGIFEQVLGKKANVKVMDKGSKYIINNKDFLQFLSSNKLALPPENYNYSVIKKYCDPSKTMR